MKKEKKPRRLWPSIWLRTILALPLLTILWIRTADVVGDRGMVNVFSFMLFLLLLLITSLWFIFFSGYSRRARFGLLLAMVTAVVLFFNLNSFILFLLLLLITSAWFIFFRGYSRRARFGLPLTIVTAVVLFFNLFNYKGVSGSMVPFFSFRFMPPEPSLSLPGAAGSTAGSTGIDLVTTTANDFSGFLGSDRSGEVAHVRLNRDWDSRPPEQVWRQPIGEGWSAFAVVNGYAVTMEQRGEDEAVTAYDARTGELLWAYAIPGRFTHPLGGIGPRSTPTIDEGRVYALGARGHFACLNGANGEVIWTKDLWEEYGVTPEQEFQNVQYGRSNSPLVVGNMVILPAGGNKGDRIASLAAYDKVTGETIWEAGERQISFASPRLATLGGVDQILIVNEDSLSGHDPASGAILWEHPWQGKTSANASASQAVPVPPDRVFVSKGYGGGSALLRLVPADGGRFDVEEIWKSSRVLRTKFTNVVIRNGYIYGLSDGILECADLETGERVWKRGRYKHGQILGVGELLLVLSEAGEVSLVDPTPEKPDRVLGRFQAVEGLTWNNLALYGDLLLVRNGREAAAWRLPLAGPPS